MSKKYRSDAMAAIHGMMAGLYDGGVIDKPTMRRLDDAFLLVLLERAPREGLRSVRLAALGLIGGDYN